MVCRQGWLLFLDNDLESIQFAIFNEIGLILRTVVFELGLEFDTFFLKRVECSFEFELGIWQPCGPFIDGLFGKFKEADNNGFEFSKVSGFGEETPCILGDSSLVCGLNDNTGDNWEQVFLGELDKGFRAHLETIFKELHM